MDKLSRYYTQANFSNLLVNQLGSIKPLHILDLGVGNGSLLDAAIGRWNTANYTAFDIEKKCFAKNPRINFIQKDLIANSADLVLDINHHQIDVAICNPPYSKLKNSIEYHHIFDKIDFNNCKQLNYLTTDLVFLALNLSLVKRGGELGIILPDTLLTSKDFKAFRKDLIRLDIVSIIELPEGSFKNTQAKTHILILNNSSSQKDHIDLLQVNKSGEITNKIYVSRNRLINRMDYTFHSIALNESQGVALQELGAIISRGQLSKKEFVSKGISFFHTSSFNSSNTVSFSKNSTKSNYTYATKNDILIARVGTRCMGKFCLVKKGEIPISDCILKVTLPAKYVDPFMNSLNSEYGRNWFKAYSHGVCAKSISKNDLLSFKVPL